MNWLVIGTVVGVIIGFVIATVVGFLYDEVREKGDPSDEL